MAKVKKAAPAGIKATVTRAKSLTQAITKLKRNPNLKKSQLNQLNNAQASISRAGKILQACNHGRTFGCSPAGRTLQSGNLRKPANKKKWFTF